MSLEIFPFHHVAPEPPETLKAWKDKVVLFSFQAFWFMRNKMCSRCYSSVVFWKKVTMQIPRNIWGLHPHSPWWWNCFTVGKTIEKSSNRTPVFCGRVSYVFKCLWIQEFFLSICFKGSIGLLVFSSDLEIFFLQNWDFSFLCSSGNSINWDFQDMEEFYRQLKHTEILW